MKKLLSIILAVLLFVSAMPMGIFTLTASAATCGTTGDCTWSLNGTVLTISGNGKMGDYSYSSSAPWGTSITKVVVENGVTSIGDYAFYNYDSLTNITIPDSVTSIGSGAFHSCTGLTSITIPDSVTSISSGAFEYCSSLTSIVIPDSVTSIGSSAFEYCKSLTSITIPDSVTSIGVYAFNVTPWYNNQPDGLVYAGKVAYKFKGTCPESITIKDGTVGIADKAFYNCKSLKNITIPNSVTSIGYK